MELVFVAEAKHVISSNSDLAREGQAQNYKKNMVRLDREDRKKPEVDKIKGK